MKDNIEYSVEYGDGQTGIPVTVTNTKDLKTRLEQDIDRLTLDTESENRVTGINIRRASPNEE